MSSKVVERVCQQCGKPFPIPAWRLKEQGRGKFCSPECSQKHLVSEETRAKMSVAHMGELAPMFGKHHTEEAKAKNRAAHIGKHLSEEHKAKIGSASKAIWEDPAFKAKVSQRLKEMWQRPEFLARMSEVHKELWQAPEFRAMMSKANSASAKKLWQSPKYRQHQMKAQIRSWQDPESVARRLASLKKRPTKPEQRLIDIFSRSLPQFKYNGDFSLGVMLGGLSPDFVNVDGKKQVIEFFGDYWHSPGIVGDDWRRGELGKVMIYNSLGWKCLVIWERELSQLSDNEVTEKVKRFFLKERHAVIHSG